MRHSVLNILPSDSHTIDTQARAYFAYLTQPRFEYNQGKSMSCPDSSFLPILLISLRQIKFHYPNGTNSHFQTAKHAESLGYSYFIYVSPHHVLVHRDLLPLNSRSSSPVAQPAATPRLSRMPLIAKYNSLCHLT